jgi:ADP-ribosylglycohydrolase/protein-tyrosine phosphatase
VGDIATEAANRKLGPIEVDRAVGAVLGSAAGDALGAGYEFGPTVTGPITMSGGGSFHWAPGEWTDDTQMATAILTAAVEARRAGRFAVTDVAAGFLAWYASRPKDVGNQTSAVLSAATSPDTLADAAAAYQRRRPDSAGNGSLMRTGPVALAGLAVGASEAEVADLAAEISRLTHPHDDAVAACILWSTGIHRLIPRSLPMPGGRTWATYLEFGLDHLPAASRDRWAGLIAEARDSDPTRFRDKNGWVVHAFQQALATLVSLHGLDEFDFDPATDLYLALEAAVRPGNDADTVGAITGAMVGAGRGASAIPLAWRRKLHGEVVGADEVSEGTGRDLERLARLAANGVDSDGWPGVDRLVPVYARRQSPPRRLTRVADRLTVGTTADLADLDLTAEWTVVSLCRMGDQDVPAEVERLEVGLIDDDTDNAHLAWLLADVADTIERLIQEEQREVFLHCVAGETRSPAALATWFARHDGRGVDKAIAESERTYRTSLRPAFAEAVHQAVNLPASGAQ